MNKIKVRFSEYDPGICPYCKHYKKCKLLNKMTSFLEKEVEPKYDNYMEIVIYSCPYYEEK